MRQLWSDAEEDALFELAMMPVEMTEQRRDAEHNPAKRQWLTDQIEARKWFSARRYDVGKDEFVSDTPAPRLAAEHLRDLQFAKSLRASIR